MDSANSQSTALPSLTHCVSLDSPCCWCVCVAACCSVLQRVVLRCSVLQYCSMLTCVVLPRHYICLHTASLWIAPVVGVCVLQCVATCCIVLQRVVLWCSVLQYCSLLTCVVVPRHYLRMHTASLWIAPVVGVCVLQCGAVRCSVLQCVDVCGSVTALPSCTHCVSLNIFCCWCVCALQFVAVCRSVLQYGVVAVWCSVLQCVAVCRSVL